MAHILFNKSNARKDSRTMLIFHCFNLKRGNREIKFRYLSMKIKMQSVFQAVQCPIKATSKKLINFISKEEIKHPSIQFKIKSLITPISWLLADIRIKQYLLSSTNPPSSTYKLWIKSINSKYKSFTCKVWLTCTAKKLGKRYHWWLWWVKKRRMMKTLICKMAMGQMTWKFHTW